MGEHDRCAIVFMQSPFEESSIASTLKSSFCEWQSSDAAMTAVEHDIAVLVTRKNICEATSCGILGKPIIQPLTISILFIGCM